MIFLAALLLNWSEIVRVLSLREREKGVGDGSVEGHSYTVVQRNGEIYIVLPDYPRDKCESIVKKLLQKLKPHAEIKMSSIGHASSHCNYCLATFSLTYRCHRCGGWYCVDHRLPERHNCPDEGEGSTAKRTQPKETRIKEQDKEKGEEIVAVRLPCA